MESFCVGLLGKLHVLEMCIRLAFKSGQQVLDGGFIFRDNGWHSISFCSPFKSLRAAAQRRCDGGYSTRWDCLATVERPGISTPPTNSLTG
jgi:hypothetical protein